MQCIVVMLSNHELIIYLTYSSNIHNQYLALLIRSLTELYDLVIFVQLTKENVKFKYLNGITEIFGMIRWYNKKILTVPD